MDDLVVRDLLDKDNDGAYVYFRKLLSESCSSDIYYRHFDEFAGLLDSESSYEVVRGFSFCCAQSRWDTERRIYRTFPKMLSMLNDPKPIAVRQYLASLGDVIEFLPELRQQIVDVVTSMDPSVYKGSMEPLIRKDISTLLSMVRNTQNEIPDGSYEADRHQKGFRTE